MSAAMPVVDAHCHASPDWYEPVESLLFQMDRHGVEKACLVQTLAETRNDYLYECRKRSPDRFAVVAGLDFKHDDVAAQVEQAAAHGASGIRLRSLWARDEKCAAALGAMAQYGLNASCAGDANGFLADAFQAHIAAHPSVVFVLEHLGGLARPDFDRTAVTRDAVMALAARPNVMLKITGLGQIRRPSPPAGRTPPLEPDDLGLLDLAVSAFGPKRLMWGSDYPPVSSREGYGNALNWARLEIERLTGGRSPQIFHSTATSAFP